MKSNFKIIISKEVNINEFKLIIKSVLLNGICLKIHKSLIILGWVKYFCNASHNKGVSNIFVTWSMRTSQIFCNILVTWGTTWRLQMLLLSSWKWCAKMDCKMLSSSDILFMHLNGFVSMAWNTVSESRVLGLSDFAWLSRFLQPKQNFFNPPLTLFSFYLLFNK